MPGESAATAATRGGDFSERAAIVGDRLTRTRKARGLGQPGLPGVWGIATARTGHDAARLSACLDHIRQLQVELDRVIAGRQARQERRLSAAPG
jgi:hypothetical protein